MSADVAAASMRAGHLHEAAASLLEMIDQLPEDVRRRFMQELLEATLDADNGDKDRLKRAITSLRVYGDLRSRDDYRNALEAAEAEEIGESVDLVAYTERLREARKSARS